MNPTLCLLLPFFLGWLIARKSPNGGRTLALGAGAVLVFVLAILPWTIRNYYAIDGWVFVKSNFGMELWLGNNPAVKKIYSPELHPNDNVKERISLILSGEPNYNRVKQRQAIDYIENHPRAFLNNLFDRFVDTWSATFGPTPRPGGCLVLHGVLCFVVCGADPCTPGGLAGFAAAGDVPAPVSDPVLHYAHRASLPAPHRSVHDNFYGIRYHTIPGDLREASQTRNFRSAHVTNSEFRLNPILHAYRVLYFLE